MSQFSNPALSWLCLILKERFGHTFVLQHTDAGVVLSIPSQGEGQIIFPHTYSVFFESRSDIPFTTWVGEAEGWQCVLGEPLPAPGIAALPSPLIEVDSQAQTAKVHYDMLGLTYWMLNRIEEMGRTDLDNHERFPAVNSHAYQHNYLDRPVVDEWLHLLGQVLQKVWPQIELTKHQFSMKVSHDVDIPSLYSFKPWITIVRMTAGHLLKRCDLKAFVQAPYIKLTSSTQISKHDSYNTFNWLMDASEANNLTSAFYFICGTTSNMDADYQPEDPRIAKLMRHMHERGHEIGLHPSYGTYQTPELIKKEADRLRGVLRATGIDQPQIGGRMHYLRWEHPATLQAWEDAGMAYDSTLSYADRPGFRCGTCFEYSAFNPQSQQQLKIHIRPLIAMECTIIAKRYMGLGYTQAALDKFTDLKDKCRKVNGCFTLLWHNSHFSNKADFEMYEKILEC